MGIDSLLIAPHESDPVGIFELFNANFANKILTAAATHFRVFERVSKHGMSFESLQCELGLQKRPMHVILTALLAFDLLKQDDEKILRLTEMARLHLVPGSPHDVTDYLRLAHDARGVKELVTSLKTNVPVSAQYIKSKGIESIMDDRDEAERLTECLAGRAINSAPVLAAKCPLSKSRLLLDIGGGTGIFAIAYLQQHPDLRAIVLDLPNVLDVAKRYAKRFGVSDRLECIAMDMFADAFPPDADAILLSNILHDWGEDKCQSLLQKCADALPDDGTLIIHDALLNDRLDGPLSIAIYSVVLFYLTEGRAYSGEEYSHWLRNVGFAPTPAMPTRVHCSVISAVRDSTRRVLANIHQ